MDVLSTLYSDNFNINSCGVLIVSGDDVVGI